MDDSTRTDIPAPESADAKEVFAFFGLAAYHAQVLEQEIFLFAVFLRLSKSANRSPALVEALLQRLDAKTFGQLLKAGRTLTDVPEAVERLLNDGLKARNRLVHRFFVEHDVNIIAEAGRRSMIDDLRASINLFQEADAALTRIRESIGERLGITKELAQAELDRKLAEARALDDAG